MKKILLFALLFLSLFFTSSNKIPNTQIDNLSYSQWLQDIDFAQAKFVKEHPNPYAKISKKEYDTKFSALKMDLKDLNNDEICLRLGKIIASIGDMHTYIQYNLPTFNALPLELKYFGDDIRIVSTIKYYEYLLGYKVLSINDVSINNILDKLSELVPNENEVFVKVESLEYIVRPFFLKYAGINIENFAVLRLEDLDGNIIKKDIVAIPYKDLSEKLSNNLKNIPQIKKDKEDKKNSFWFEYIPENKILYFRYQSCIDLKHAMNFSFANYNLYPSFENFLDKILSFVEKNEIKKFVIDIRGNTGGSYQLMEDLMYYLAKNKNWRNNINKKGHLYVLLDNYTMSAAVINCEYLKLSTRAIFVGEPSGSNVECYGLTTDSYFKLPNSKLIVNYPALKIYNGILFKENFIPDVIVEQSLDGYFNGIDDAFQYILDAKCNDNEPSPHFIQ